jgi:drug/metabolite transporter (DMT)-like permease
MGDSQGVDPPAAHSGPAGPAPPRTAGLRGVDPLAASAYVSSGAACSFLAAAVVVGGSGLQGAAPSAYAAGAAMAVVGTALAIAAFLGRHGQGRVAWASIASSFEPVFTVALGVAVLGDRLGPGKIVGGLAVVAGAVLLPLLSGTREAVGSGVQPEYTPTRGSTRR